MFCYLVLAAALFLAQAQPCPSTTITALAEDGLPVSCTLNYAIEEISNQCVFASCSSSCSPQGQTYTDELLCRTQCPYNHCIDAKLSDSGQTQEG